MAKPTEVDQIVDELLGRSNEARREAKLIDQYGADTVISKLADVLSDERKLRIEDVLSRRTERITTVVEGVLNTGNVAAVMRTSEALGFHSFHVITDNNPFKQSTRTSQGAHKWMDIHEWKSPAECVAYLKEHGYQIVVTHLTAGAEPVDTVDFTQKTALVFGNEMVGVSDEMLKLADRTCLLPLTGFVQSYNISVAAAIALHVAFTARVREFGKNGDLSEQQLQKLRATYYFRATDKSEDILEREST